MMVRSIVLAHVILLLLPQASSFGLLKTVLWKQFQATTVAIALTATLLGSSPPILPTQPPVEHDNLPSALAAPTQDRPQIQLSGNNLITLQQDKDAPILEALLYLADPQVRPGPLDTIVITVRGAGDAKSGTPPVLAGAKLPVQKIRFPVQLRLYKQNLVQPEAWDRAEDVTVRAVVCPDGTVIPCSEHDITMQAEGISKLVRNLPGLPEGIGVRAGAALPLK